MLGIEPKDFDVATDALPEQVKKLFRNCRLVGRRFRLAHVFFGREIIEVATFREPPFEDFDITLLAADATFDGDVIARKIVSTEAILVASRGAGGGRRRLGRRRRVERCRG